MRKAPIIIGTIKYESVSLDRWVCALWALCIFYKHQME